MELECKFNEKNIFSWSNCGEARKYLNTRGYFGDSLDELNDAIKNNRTRSLIRINDNDATLCFEGSYHDEMGYALFLPIELMREHDRSSVKGISAKTLVR